jgi:hypothetical protein
MKPGTYKEAKQLAQARWARIHSFDLEDAQWDHLFTVYRFGTVLEGIKKTADTVDPRPERRYARFINILNSLSTPHGR